MLHRRGERFKFNAGGTSRHATGEEWSPTVTLCVVRPLQVVVCAFPYRRTIFNRFICRGRRPRRPVNERFRLMKWRVYTISNNSINQNLKCSLVILYLREFLEVKAPFSQLPLMRFLGFKEPFFPKSPLWFLEVQEPFSQLPLVWFLEFKEPFFKKVLCGGQGTFFKKGSLPFCVTLRQNPTYNVLSITLNTIGGQTMAIFTNQAVLSYRNGSVSSNVVTGELVQVLSATKNALLDNYVAGDVVTYVVTLFNAGTAPLNNVTVTDDLGAYPFGTGEVTPLTYVTGSVAYYLDGVLQPQPAVSTTPELTFSGITVPAGDNALIIYQARVNDFAPLGVDIS